MCCLLVAADHLDDYGVTDLEALADIKWLVTRPLGDNGVAILNAEDPRLVERAAGFGSEIAWFALDATPTTIVEDTTAPTDDLVSWIIEQAGEQP